MNATRLLAHYEAIGDAPNALERMRRFVLDLAVRGRLVAQDSEDVQGKTASVPKGAGRNNEANMPDEGEFSLPSSWYWAKISQVTSKTGSGSTPRGGKEVYKKSGVPFLRSQNIYNDGLRLEEVAYIDIQTHERMKATAVEPSDLLLNITGGSIGRCCLVPSVSITANISQHVAIIRPITKELSPYLHLVVRSPYFQAHVWSEQTGAGRGGLPKNKMDKILVPVPPSSEQIRIVAKVDELMALCDRLCAAQEERDERRNQFGAAILTRLSMLKHSNESDVAIFLDSLATLTMRPGQLSALRQTIISLGVTGGLSAKDMSFTAISLGTVASLQNGYAFKSEWFSKSGERLVRNANVSHGELNWEDEVRLPNAKTGEFERFRLREGDIVVSLDRPFITTGTKVARVKHSDLPALLLQRVGRFVLTPALDANYLYLWIRSPEFERQINPGRSNGVPHISSKQVEAAEICVPPLAEQRRIVAKVSELMALCDQLEKTLIAADETRSKLLTALLAEALEDSGMSAPSAGSETVPTNPAFD